MKNRTSISFLFSLFLLVALSCQIAGKYIDLSLDRDPIELSESNDGTQSEEDLEEKTIASFESFSTQTEIQSDKTEWIYKNINSSFVFIKIPSPPPEVT